MKKIEIQKNRKRVFTVNTEPSMTDPSWAEDCDVNYIMNRFMKTGQISHLAAKQGVYADLTEIPDLLGAITQVQKANDAFSLLPGNVRQRFQNDPVQLIEFLKDPKNDQEAIELGLKVSSPVAQQPGANKPEGRVSAPPPQQSQTTQTPQTTEQKT